jgi:ribosome-binding factor A
MSVDRMTRLNELLRREIGEALFRLVHERGFDLSAVTVTHVEITRDLREARVFVSIRDHEAERERMLARIRGHRAELQAVIAKHLTMKYTPRLTFVMDASIERGDHVLAILNNMPADEAQEGAAAPAPENPGEGEVAE